MNKRYTITSIALAGLTCYGGMMLRGRLDSKRISNLQSQNQSYEQIVSRKETENNILKEQLGDANKQAVVYQNQNEKLQQKNQFLNEKIEKTKNGLADISVLLEDEK